MCTIVNVALKSLTLPSWTSRFQSPDTMYGSSTSVAVALSAEVVVSVALDVLVALLVPVKLLLVSFAMPESFPVMICDSVVLPEVFPVMPVELSVKLPDVVPVMLLVVLVSFVDDVDVALLVVADSSPMSKIRLAIEPLAVNVDPVVVAFVLDVALLVALVEEVVVFADDVALLDVALLVLVGAGPEYICASTGARLSPAAKSPKTSTSATAIGAFFIADNVLK